MSDHSDKRFEAALRLFLAMIEEDFNRDLVPNDEAIGAFARAAVGCADKLLAELRKDKP